MTSETTATTPKPDRTTPAAGRGEVMSRISHALERASEILVVSHLDPDGDALGSMLAMTHYLKECGKNVMPVRDSAIPEKYHFLPGVESILVNADRPADFRPNTIVVLECPETGRMGTAAASMPDAREVIAIDHHVGNAFFGTIDWVEPAASSVAEMLFQYFEYVGYRLNSVIADCLYTGLLTDTGRFRYESTSAETFRIASELRSAGADIRGIVDQVYYQLSPASLQMLGRVLSGMELLEAGRLCVLTLSTEVRRSTGILDGDADGLTEYSLYPKHVEVGLVFKEGDDGGVKVSIRTYRTIDAQAIAAKFGGGGHRNAAGCRIVGSLATAREKVIGAATEALRNGRHARA